MYKYNKDILVCSFNFFLSFFFNVNKSRFSCCFVALQVKLQEAIEYDDLQGDSGRKTIALNLKKSDR